MVLAGSAKRKSEQRKNRCRAYAGTCILLLVQDLHVRIVDAATGELLRDLTLDPVRNYQPTGRPPGPTPQSPASEK